MFPQPLGPLTAPLLQQQQQVLPPPLQVLPPPQQLLLLPPPVFQPQFLAPPPPQLLLPPPVMASVTAPGGVLSPQAYPTIATPGPTAQKTMLMTQAAPGAMMAEPPRAPFSMAPPLPPPTRAPSLPATTAPPMTTRPPTKPPSTRAPAATSGGGAGGGGQRLPSQVLDLTNWSLALPVPDRPGSKKPMSINQPQLRTYTSEWFYVTSDGGVAFKARPDGVTSANTKYPRSELREMTNNGTKNAAWSTAGPPHTMEFTEAITKTTAKKPHVCAAQIHGVKEAPVMIRLEGTKLVLQEYGKPTKTLNENYRLGTRFTAKFVSGNKKIEVYYEDMSRPVHVYDADPAKDKLLSGCYYKIGNYLQSNVKDKGESPSDYGEVVVYSVKVY